MILVWNVRGAGKRSFAQSIRDLIHLYHIQLLVILEPHISGARALSVIQAIGFTKFFVVEADGFAGGLWMLWNDEALNIQILECSHYTITAYIEFQQRGWLFTSVYASPHFQGRQALWRYLDGVQQLSLLPWLVAGDFNEVLYNSERQGSSTPSRSSGTLPWVQRNSLIDLEYIGADFTWSKKGDSNLVLRERLDRSLSNVAWRILFPEATVRHLHRIHSGHCPLLIKLDSTMLPRSAYKPFKYHAMWQLDGTFTPMITEFWSLNHSNIVQKLSDCQHRIQQWNAEQFGNIFRRKKRLISRLEGISTALSQHYNPFLVTLEQDLLSEYNLPLEQEAKYWKQKSRLQWTGTRNFTIYPPSLDGDKTKLKDCIMHKECGRIHKQGCMMWSVITFLVFMVPSINSMNI